MAVFVYATGSVFQTAGVTASAKVDILNRTLDTQTARVVVWDTSVSPKTIVSNGNQLVSIPANNDVTVGPIFVPAGGTKFEVEIRLSNPHIAPFVRLVAASEDFFKPFEMFRDSSETENP